MLLKILDFNILYVNVIQKNLKWNQAGKKMEEDNEVPQLGGEVACNNGRHNICLRVEFGY